MPSGSGGWRVEGCECWRRRSDLHGGRRGLGAGRAGGQQHGALQAVNARKTGWRAQIEDAASCEGAAASAGRDVVRKKEDDQHKFHAIDSALLAY